MILLCLLCLLSLLWSVPVHAATYYVDGPGGNGPGGLDTNGCNDGNPNAARATLNAGISCMSGGDTLLIRGGTYTNQPIGQDSALGFVPSGFNELNRTIIRAAPGEIVILSGFNAGIKMSAGEQFVTFDSLIVDMGGSQESALYTQPPATDIRFQNGEMRNVADGSLIQGDHVRLEVLNTKIHDVRTVNSAASSACYGAYYAGFDGRFEGNEFYDIDGFGMHMFSSGSSSLTNNVIINNVFRNNGLNGCNLGSGAGSLLIGSGAGNKAYNNIIYDSIRGIDIGSNCIGCEVIHNTIVNNNGFGQGTAVIIGPTNNFNIVVRNNIMWGNGDDSVNVNSGQGTHTIQDNRTTDPAFVNASAGLFSLQPGSTAINTVPCLSSVPLDSAGVTRPQGSSCEPGALEFVQGGGATPNGNPIYLSGGGHGDTPSDGNGSVESCIAAENIATPKATLGGALACMNAVPGKELRIRGGTYSAVLDTMTTPIVGGTSWANATRLTGYQSETVTLQLPVGQTVLAYFRNPATDGYIILNKLIFDAASRPSSTTFAVVGGHHIRVIDSTIRNAAFENVYLEGVSDIEFTSSGQTPIMAILNGAGYGVHGGGAITNLLIEKTRLQGHASQALYLNLESGSNTNTRLLRNIFSQNGAEAIGLGPGTGAQIVNNQIYRNFAGLRVASGATGVTLSNNLAANNTNRGFQCDAGATGLRWRNTLAWGNTPNPILNNCGGTLITNMDTIDPIFTNEATDTYTLQSTSQAINAGTNLGAEVPVDFNGAPRPGQPGSTGGLHYDIGPFERDSGPPQPPSGMGPLVVDGVNGRYFKRPDGQLTYLAGAYDWDFLRPTMTDLEAAAYLDFWVSTNQNVVRAPNWDPIIFTTTDPNPPFDTAYWAFAATRVALAQSKGVYVMIPIFHFLEQLPFTDLTFCETYAQQVVDALGSYDNVLWEVGNELATNAHDGGTVGFFVDHLVDVIKARQVSQGHLQVPVGISEYDADGVPGVGTQPAVITAMLASSADFVTIGWSEVATLQDTVLPIDRAGAKVVFVDSDHIWPYGVNHVWVWKLFMRGHNPQVLDGNEFFPGFSQDDDGNPSPTTFDARMRIGDTRLYAARMNMQLATPQPGLSTTGWALANPGVEYLVYQPGSGAFNVTLVSGTYDVEWFDASDQVIQSAAQVTGSGSTAFTPPFNDAVLFLKAAVIPPVVANTQRVPLYMQSWFH